MPGISHASTESSGARFASVRLVHEAAAAPPVSHPAPNRPAGLPRGAVPIIELALHNGRVLRVAETIAPETLARLAAALDR